MHSTKYHDMMAQEAIEATQRTKGSYVGLCDNCGRSRLCLLANATHVCDKCNFCKETNQYVED